MTLSYTLDTPFFTWGETIKGTFRVKMGSNESIHKNRNGRIELLLAPHVSLNGESQYDEFGGYWDSFVVYVEEDLDIGAGKQTAVKNFEFTLPLATDRYTPIDFPEYSYIYEERFAQIAENYGVDLAGTDRLQPWFTITAMAEELVDDGWKRIFADKTFKHSGGFLYSRLAPSYTDFAMNDEGEKNPLSVLDAYLLGGESVPVISSNATIDALDTTLTATHKIELMSQAEEGSTPTVITSAEAPIGTPLKPTMPKSMELDYTKYVTDADGMKWVYSVTDSAGNTATGTYYKRVYNYSLPVLLPVGANPVVERYKTIIDDEGNVRYEVSADSADVWTSYHTEVTPFATAGQNTWTLAIVYGVDGSSDTQTITKTGSDATDGDVVKDRTTFEDVGFAASTRYLVTMTLTDVIGRTAVLTAYLDKAGGYFNIEKNGVAVGMRSTGAANGKLFEVASDYEARFYGGIRGVNIYSTEEVDTGGRWIDGEKIYAKTIVKTGAASGTTYKIPLGVLFGVAWIDPSATFNKATNGYTYPCGYVISNGSRVCCVSMDGSNVSCLSEGSGGDFYIRVCYTKIITGETLKLYDHGDECTSVVGGWTAYAYKTASSGSTVKKPTITKYTDSIRLTLANSNNNYVAGCMMTDNAVDVTDYDLLVANITQTDGAGYIGVSATKANNYTAIARSAATATGRLEVDLTNVTGAVYILAMIQAVQSSTKRITFDLLQLEKRS